MDPVLETENAQFPQFVQLPAELRSLIWHLAVQDARVHRVGVCLESGKALVSDTLASSTTESRALLAACRESRDEVIRVLPVVLSFTAASKTYSFRYDPATDVICLAEGTGTHACKIVDLARHRARRSGATAASAKSALEWTEQIQQLALEGHATDSWWDWLKVDTKLYTPERPDTHLEFKFLAVFPRLKELLVVVASTRDDPASLRMDVPTLDDPYDTDTDEVESAHDYRGWLTGRSPAHGRDWYRRVPMIWGHRDESGVDDSQENLLIELSVWVENVWEVIPRYLKEHEWLLDDDATRQRIEGMDFYVAVHFDDEGEMPERDKSVSEESWPDLSLEISKRHSSGTSMRSSCRLLAALGVALCAVLFSYFRYL